MGYGRNNTPRFHRMETKKIDTELHEKINELIWKRMEQQSQESPEERSRRDELYKVIEKIKITPTNKNNEQGTSGETQIEETDQQTEETMLSPSNESINVPAIFFKKILGATGLRFIQMRQASHVQNNNEWNLGETVRQAEQKFATYLKTIAMETTNGDKLLKTLICLEGKTINQIPEESKQYTKDRSTRFGVMFYDDKIIIPKKLRNTVITLLQKVQLSINKMTHAAKLFWWPKGKIQQRCDECVPCKMTGESIKPQIPMSEMKYLPPVDKTNQEILLHFIRPIRCKQR